MNGLQFRFLRCMRDAGAPCLAIGGFAIRALGINRITIDLDVVTSTAHPAQTHAGLVMFDSKFAEVLSPEQLELPQKRVVIPSQHGNEIDLLTSVGGFDFSELYGRRFEAHAKDVNVAFASAADQLAIKRISLASVQKDITTGVPTAELPGAHAAREVAQRICTQR